MDFNDMNSCARKYLEARRRRNDGEAANFLSRLYEMVFREDFCKCVIAHIDEKNKRVIQYGASGMDTQDAPGYILFEREPYCYYQGIFSDTIDRSIRKLKNYEGPLDEFNFVGLFETMAQNAKKDEFLSGKRKTVKGNESGNVPEEDEEISEEDLEIPDESGKSSEEGNYTSIENPISSMPGNDSEGNELDLEDKISKYLQENEGKSLLFTQFEEPQEAIAEKEARAEVFDKLAELGHQIVRLHLLKGKENNPERQHYYRLFYTEQLNECLEIISESSDEKELRSDAKRSGGIFRHEDEILQEIIWEAFLKYYTREESGCDSFIAIMKAVRKTYGETCGDISARADGEVQFPFPHSLYRRYMERIEHKQTSDANISKMSRNYSGYLEKFKKENDR